MDPASICDRLARIVRSRNTQQTLVVVAEAHPNGPSANAHLSMRLCAPLGGDLGTVVISITISGDGCHCGILAGVL
jgi:hypothetical protein